MAVRLCSVTVECLPPRGERFVAMLRMTKRMPIHSEPKEGKLIICAATDLVFYQNRFSPTEVRAAYWVRKYVGSPGKSPLCRWPAIK
jgi:hypothetical protein